ncbi:MAG: hypothetical protein H6683_07500 [Deltaproteobacteria bacterium]|nr:hypothetical protein [Deltaproteobacteria bacterium]
MLGAFDEIDAFLHGFDRFLLGPRIRVRTGNAVDKNAVVICGVRVTTDAVLVHTVVGKFDRARIRQWVVVIAVVARIGVGTRQGGCAKFHGGSGESVQILVRIADQNCVYRVVGVVAVVTLVAVLAESVAVLVDAVRGVGVVVAGIVVIIVIVGRVVVGDIGVVVIIIVASAAAHGEEKEQAGRHHEQESPTRTIRHHDLPFGESFRRCDMLAHESQ